MITQRPLYLMLALCVFLSACSGSPEPGRQSPFRGVKVGKPYKIEGTWYRPAYAPDYVEEGYASWYGPGFHGKSTANGEKFDQYAMTAAHKTLPLPSLVKVENLENGRSITVRLNDRGPFVGGRIIDLSKASAEALGMRSKGLAKVRVSYLAEETAHYIAERGGVPLERKYASISNNSMSAIPQNNLPELIADNSRVQSESAPVLSVNERELPVLSSGKPVIVTTNAPPTPPVFRGVSYGSIGLASTPDRNSGYPHGDIALNTAEDIITVPEKVYRKERPKADSASHIKSGSFIQAASFSNADNASRLVDRLTSSWKAEVSSVIVKGKTWYRVHVGPVSDKHTARQMLDKLASLGLPDARIITR